MAVGQALGLMDGYALQGDFLLRRSPAAVHGNLRYDAVIKIRLQGVNGQAVHMAGVYQLFKEEIHLQLVIPLFPEVAAAIAPGFQRIVDLPDDLQDGLCAQTGHNVLPPAFPAARIGQQQVHKADKGGGLPLEAAGARAFPDGKKIGFGDVQMGKVRGGEAVEIPGLVKMHQGVYQGHHIQGGLGAVEVTAGVGPDADARLSAFPADDFGLPVFPHEDGNALFL